MKKISIILGSCILGSAIIWGAVILGCSLKLSGTECYDEISNALIMGASFHLILIWGPLAAYMAKHIKKKD
ncbi:MAG: hypothetical protein GY865_11450 [candidate division Zixibacteria bacterium]|nr:hypothetical protein [candidate division Zixibacteria bacterium]